MHFSEWRGFVVNTVAMTFQIVGKTVTKPVVFVSRILSVPIEVGPILRLFTGKIYLVM